METPTPCLDEETDPELDLTGELQALRPFDTYNRLLQQNTHPLQWENPRPTGRYNLVVIGGGTAGLVTAAGAAGLGAKVALVESRLMGGDCLNVGCVPSKALIRCARAAADVRAASRFGVRIDGGVTVDFPGVMRRMRRLRAKISHHDSAARFRELGVDVFIGKARFVSRDAVEVRGARLEFARACIATGGRPAAPPVPGLEESGYLTNETVFSLVELPPRLAVLGAGPVGCEMAQAFARLGSKVTLIESEKQILSKENPDAADIVRRALSRDDVRIICGGKAAQVSHGNGTKIIALQCDGEHQQIEVDEILVAAGRTPNVEELDLGRAGVAHDRHGVTVNDYLRTSNPQIYAAGDVCFKYKFTHTADALARIVIQNALFFGRAKASALTVPWCTYTDPEIAHVGLTEHEARQRGIDVRTFAKPLSEVDRPMLDGEEEGLLKVHVRNGGDTILGATLVARHAGEMISEITLAMVAGAGLKTLGRTIHPYPTQAEVFRKVADDYQRTRLRPWMKRLFTRFLSWRRR